MTLGTEVRATVPALYHPTIAVDDLDAARDWFRRVFRRKPLRWAETLDLGLLEPDYPTDYSFFAFITDTHWVFLCPPLHAQGSLSGQTRYLGVPDGMIGLGWYTDDAVELFGRLAAAGVRAHDQQGRLITSERPPVSSYARDILTGFTEPDDTGIRYEFQETGLQHWAKYAEQADPRLTPGWTPTVPDPEDPLGILATSHHRIETHDLARALRLYTELLDGSVVGERTDAASGDRSTFVSLADTVLEFVVPAGGSGGPTGGLDLYTGVTFLVDDLDAVAAHLSEVGVDSARREGEVAIPPAAGFGAEWRFVDRLPYPASARRAPAF